MHGPYAEYFPNGDLKYEVNYQAGKKSGLEIFYYENGQERETTIYKFGKAHGEHFRFYKNGSVSLSGKYAGNKKIEEWKYVDEEGDWLKTEIYFNDKLKETKFPEEEN